MTPQPDIGPAGGVSKVADETHGEGRGVLPRPVGKPSRPCLLGEDDEEDRGASSHERRQRTHTGRLVRQRGGVSE